MTVAMEGINKSSAASRFARTAVILRALGEQVSDGFRAPNFPQVLS